MEAAEIHRDDKRVTFLSNGAATGPGTSGHTSAMIVQAVTWTQLPLPSASSHIVAGRIRQYISPAIRDILANGRRIAIGTVNRLKLNAYILSKDQDPLCYNCLIWVAAWACSMARISPATVKLVVAHFVSPLT